MKRHLFGATSIESRRGFNLIEAAIVLGIVGIVVGAIWVAAASVYGNLRAKTASEQLLAVVQKIRLIYAANPIFLPSGTAVQGLIAQNAFPATMVENGNALVSPFGGPVLINGSGAPADSDGNAFGIVYNGLSQDQCIDLVSRNVGSASMATDIGMIGVVPTNAAVAAVPTLVTGQTNVQTPMAINAIAGLCHDPGTANAVTFFFRTRVK